MDLLNPDAHIPWVTFEAKEWLDGYLCKNMAVFEWGTGGSTLYYAKHAGRVTSVEHNPEWHQAVQSALRHEQIGNSDYFLILPQPHGLARHLPYGPHTYVSRTFDEHKGLFFWKYVRKIDEFPDGHFDLVMVDGRSRAACMHHAVRKIKKGGFLLLDNSERELYRPAMDRLAKFDRKDFFGKGPYLVEEWQTTIWQIQ